jgi:glycosyltransferase involved in cell wall biosynthesis
MAPHAVTVVSRVLQDYVAERYHRTAIGIPTGINPPTPHAPELIRTYGLHGGDYFLFAGRLVREKGAHYLIEAFRRARGAATRTKLVIAGDANYEEAYKAELRGLAADDPRIVFTGRVRGQLLSELMTNTLCFVLPSDVEGLATVLLEAMSYGAPCLASDIPENLEALQGLGHTFKAADVASLAHQLESLAEDASVREKYRDTARRHVEMEHSWDRIALQFEELYEQVLAGAEITPRS